MGNLIDRSTAVVAAWARYTNVVDTTVESEVPAWADVNDAVNLLAAAVADHRTTGPMLAGERLDRRLRVGQVASAMGVTPAYISMVERNPRPTESVVDKYRESLDIAMANAAIRDVEPVAAEA